MQLNAQQQAAQRNLSYLLAEKIGQRILSGEYQAGVSCLENLSLVTFMVSAEPPFVRL